MAFATNWRFLVARMQRLATTSRWRRMMTVPACKTTPWAYAAVDALRMRMAMASVTQKSLVARMKRLATSTRQPRSTTRRHVCSTTCVGCVTVLETCSNVVVKTSLREIVIAMATSLTPWASVAEIALLTRMPMAFATTWTTALANWMLAASATVQVRFMSADVLTSPLATAIATATSLTPWASVAAIA